MNDGVTQFSKFLNTGTFVKRKDKWQAVGWQSTKMASPEEQSKNEVATLGAAFQRALLKADMKIAGTLLDDTFVWTNANGEKLTKQLLIDDLRTEKLKFATLETKNVLVSIYGDTAIVRGEALCQRSSNPTKPDAGDAGSSKASYTMIFVNFGGTWKAVAMHSSPIEN